jgi:LysR family glycine cleavage system transcriptional activator
MINQKLPPLNALRAFEAAARHLSVKLAAEELCVSSGAVSQLVKSLEVYLGVRLFKRVNRGILLTDVGQNYLPPIRNAFRQIAEATQRVESAECSFLTVSVPPLFAAAWFVPRLRSFQTLHPEIDLQVQTGIQLTDFVRDGVNVAVRRGLGRYPGLHAERLFSVALLAVASSSLVAEIGAPRAGSDLTRWPLVHDAAREDWHLWFRAQGITEIEKPKGPAFDDFSLHLQAVLAGQGAGLVPAVMVAEHLTEGRLIQLTNVVWPEEYAYYLVYPEASHTQSKVTAFREWIVNAAIGENSADTPGLKISL